MGILTLALAFLFLGCTSYERDNATDPGSDNYNSELLLNSSSSFITIACPAYNSSTHFCDTRDGTAYKIARIGTQIWMGENLKYDANGSVCNNDLPSNCEIYGKLYDWATAMNLSQTYISSLYNKSGVIQGICPAGWHLPSEAEWGILVNFAGGSSTAGTKLKANSNWKNDDSGKSGNGQDTYGFTALPGGFLESDGEFGSVGYHGYWWTSSEYSGTIAYAYGMHYNEDLDVDGYDKSGYQSIRCINNAKNEFTSSSSNAPYSSSSTPKSSSSIASSSSSAPKSSSSIKSSSSSAPKSSSSGLTYTITYNAGPGVTDVTVPNSQTKTNGVTLTLDDYEPTRTSYTFVGWNTAANGTGTSYASGGSYLANASVTLYAQWNQTDIIYGPDVEYGNEIYSTVVIGTQTWFNRNLNYARTGSKCGDEDGVLSDEDTYTCYNYGRLYNWATAMALPANCNSSSCSAQIDPIKHKGICPNGWHIPSKAEWDTLTAFVQRNNNCANCDAKHLKAASDWNGTLGKDTYGFAALPSGYSESDYFVSNGSLGAWWTATESNASQSYYRSMKSNDDASYQKNYYYKISLYSVRCIKD